MNLPQLMYLTVKTSEYVVRFANHRRKKKNKKKQKTHEFAPADVYAKEIHILNYNILMNIFKTKKSKQVIIQ